MILNFLALDFLIQKIKERGFQNSFSRYLLYYYTYPAMRKEKLYLLALAWVFLHHCRKYLHTCSKLHTNVYEEGGFHPSNNYILVIICCSFRQCLLCYYNWQKISSPTLVSKQTKKSECIRTEDWQRIT